MSTQLSRYIQLSPAELAVVRQYSDFESLCDAIQQDPALINLVICCDASSWTFLARPEPSSDDDTYPDEYLDDEAINDLLRG